MEYSFRSGRGSLSVFLQEVQLSSGKCALPRKYLPMSTNSCHGTFNGITPRSFCVGQLFLGLYSPNADLSQERHMSVTV